VSAVEGVRLAIRRLENVKSILGHVEVGADPDDLYARVEEDEDEDGDRFATGLSIGGGDSDEEINQAIATLNATVDAQLAILTCCLRMEGEPGLRFNPLDHTAFALARAINGVTS
jgi:hypothetical protein